MWEILFLQPHGTNLKRKHQLHAEGRSLMETKLERITQLSKENPDMVFSSIGHIINMEMLKAYHKKMDRDKAVGIDGVTDESSEPSL